MEKEDTLNKINKFFEEEPTFGEKIIISLTRIWYRFKHFLEREERNYEKHG